MENPTGWRRPLLELQAMGPVQGLGLLVKIITLIAVPFALLVFPKIYHDPVLSNFFCVLFIVTVILLIEEEFRWHRKARYAEAMQFFHNAHHALRDAFWELEAGKSDGDIVHHIKIALSAIASGFSLVTGVYCRACIKLLLVDDPSPNNANPRPYVETLSRHDDTPAPTKLFDKDFADANSDFWMLIKQPQERVFISNNLRKAVGYRNTHWPNTVERGTDLPYTATMVWPIRKMVQVAGDAAQPDTLGFLCVDTKSRYVFWKRYDFPVGAAFADAAYCLIRRWRDQRGGSVSLLINPRKEAI